MLQSTSFEEWLKEKHPAIDADLRAKLVAAIAAIPEPVRDLYQAYTRDTEMEREEQSRYVQ